MSMNWVFAKRGNIKLIEKQANDRMEMSLAHYKIEFQKP